MIIVEQTGPLSLITDKGRPGLAHLGVSPSGAADRTAYELGNRLIGNSPRAAAIEITGGGLQVRVDALTWVAVTGAPTQVRVNTTPTASHTPIALAPGDRLRVTPPPHGLRNYLCVRGGLRGPRTLGSRSTDTLSGLGPAPLQPGDRIPVGVPRRDMPGIDLVVPNQPRRELEIDPGPRRDWFTEQAWRRLIGVAWSVTNDCDRVGVRLSGSLLPRSGEQELPSEGLVRGAVQVPSSGQPLIFLADHPVTGGYPVIAVLTARDADHAAQLRPGDEVRFRARHPG
ncbi:MAG TPA: biotin-dependent carboxyltransferase family protein [Microlunatus sp.]|nr:biotin-dependent carboxyltransferase family protein [Microlunatus sp.]